VIDLGMLAVIGLVALVVLALSAWLVFRRKS